MDEDVIKVIRETEQWISVAKRQYIRQATATSSEDTSLEAFWANEEIRRIVVAKDITQMWPAKGVLWIEAENCVLEGRMKDTCGPIQWVCNFCKVRVNLQFLGEVSGLLIEM